MIDDESKHGVGMLQVETDGNECRAYLMNDPSDTEAGRVFFCSIATKLVNGPDSLFVFVEFATDLARDMLKDKPENADMIIQSNTGAVH